MNAPSHRISIAIPAYNAAATLPATLGSILSQGYEEWDASVVDDGSTDATVSVLQEYAERDPRVHFISQANAGTGAAMNAAFDNARGDFIAQFGADDELMPGYMSTMVAFIDEHPGFDIYSCNAWIQYPDGTRQTYSTAPKGSSYVSMSFEDYLLGMPYLFAGGALISRTLYRRVGGFRTEYFAEDVDFWRRALAFGARHIHCPVPLVIYNKGIAGQKSADRRRILESVLATDLDILQSTQLGNRDRALLEQAIERDRQRLEHGGTVDELAAARLEAQARAFRLAIVRLAGEEGGERALSALHHVTRLFRPARAAMARTLARASRAWKR